MYTDWKSIFKIYSWVALKNMNILHCTSVKIFLKLYVFCAGLILIEIHFKQFRWHSLKKYWKTYISFESVLTTHPPPKFQTIAFHLQVSDHIWPHTYLNSGTHNTINYIDITVKHEYKLNSTRNKIKSKVG